MTKTLDVGFQVSAPPLAAEASRLIEKETLPFWRSFTRGI
jgi:hypothetical protein